MISIKPLFGLLAYRNISLSQLTEKSGVSTPTLSRMKKTGQFTFSVIDKICLALNVSIKDIMRYED